MDNIDMKHHRNPRVRWPAPGEKLRGDHIFVGTECVVCGEKFAGGEAIAMIELGPGDDPEARERCAADLLYEQVVLPSHWECTFGSPGRSAREILADDRRSKTASGD